MAGMTVTDRDRLAGRLAEVLEGRPEILEAYLFGSRARGTARPDTTGASATRGWPGPAGWPLPPPPDEGGGCCAAPGDA